MTTVLKNILSFSGLVVGVPVAQAHLININGIAKIPRLIAANSGGYTITADATNVTVTRLTGASGSVKIYCEYWHSIEDAEPPGGIAPADFPFVLSNTASGGGSGIDVDKDGVVVVSPTTTLNFTGQVTVVDAGGGQATVDIGAMTPAITPAALPAGNTNDYNPTGWGTSPVLRVTPDAAAGSTLTGFLALSDGVVRVIRNVGSANLRLSGFDAASAAANRMSFPVGAENLGYVDISPGGTYALIYETATLRWVGLDNMLGLLARVEITKLSLGFGFAAVALPTGPTEDWAPTSGIRTVGNTTLIRVITDTFGSILGGLAGGHVGDIVVLENHGDGSGTRSNGQLRLLNRSAGSAVGNKFVLSDLLDVIIPYTGSIVLYYDSTTVGWIPIAASQGGFFETATIGQLDLCALEPAALAAGNNNDWNGTGSTDTHVGVSFATRSFIRVTANTGAILTGMNPNLPAGASGYLNGIVKILENAGSAGILISDEDANSSAGNRFSCPNGSFVLPPKQTQTFIYDFGSARWRPVAVSAIASKQTLYGAITDLTLGANVNDYNPAGFAYTQRLRLASAAATALSGMVEQEDGAQRTITAYSGGITITHQDAASAARNRFYLPGGANIALAAGQSQQFNYDSTFGAWFCA